MMVAVCLVSIIWKYAQPYSVYADWFSRVGQCVFYTGAGRSHFSPNRIPFFEAIIPSFFPFKLAIIYISGVIEFVLGVLILIPALNNIVAWLIILLLIAIFPANLSCLSPSIQAKTGFTPTAALIRLPFQLLFVLWAYQLTTLPLEDTVRILSLQGIVRDLVKTKESIF